MMGFRVIGVVLGWLIAGVGYIQKYIGRQLSVHASVATAERSEMNNKTHTGSIWEHEGKWKRK